MEAEVRALVAAELTAFADVRRAAAYRYAHELDICARRSNDAVTNAYYTAAAIARDGNRRNVHCAKCGDTKGGPFGHETSECTWKPCDSPSVRRSSDG
jgi:hypothetical protein